MHKEDGLDGKDAFGPLDDRLPELPISGEEKLHYTREAHSRGMDLTAYVRMLIRNGHYKEALHQDEKVPTFLRSATK